MIALQKLWKIFFISSKKLFSISVHSDFLFPSFSIFPPVGHCFRWWSKINLKVYNVLNCPNKNLIIYFVWYLEKEDDIQTLSIDRVLNNEHFYAKIMQKNVQQKLVPDPFLDLVNKPNCMQNILLKIRYFERRLLKSL